MAQYDIEAIRKKIQTSLAGKHADPDEFRPPKANSATEPKIYRFYILPPYGLGESICGGKVKAKKSMDNQFFITHAEHWVDNRPYPCPRVADAGECPICQFGFDLLKEESIKSNLEKKRAVIQQWMPNQQYSMNIYFPHDKKNPEDIRGKVMVYNAPKTVADACMRTLMSDDAGDDENPQAFGLFFDESHAFVFELQILKQGNQNSYKTSRFLATPRPMVRKEDGSPDVAELAKLLEKRHDLHSKIDPPDLEKIKKVFAAMKDGTEPPSKDGGFDVDDTKSTPAPVVVEPAKTTTSRSATKPKTQPADDFEEVPPKVAVVAAVKTTVQVAAAPVAEPLAAETPLPESEVPGLASMLAQLDEED